MGRPHKRSRSWQLAAQSCENVSWEVVFLRNACRLSFRRGYYGLVHDFERQASGTKCMECWHELALNRSGGGMHCMAVLQSGLSLALRLI